MSGTTHAGAYLSVKETIEDRYNKALRRKETKHKRKVNPKAKDSVC